MENVPYAEVVGLVMYLFVCTNGKLRKFMSCPGKEHWNAMQRNGYLGTRKVQPTMG